MNCPVCSSPTAVLEKRGDERRRECTSCRHRFTTTEVLRDERRKELAAVQTVIEVVEKLKAA